MASAAIADFLTDFGVRPRGPAQSPAHSPVLTVVAEHPSAQDVEAQVAAAVAKTEQELTARLESLHEARLTAEREAHAAELDALNAKQGEELGAKLTAAMRELEERNVDVSSDAAARVLAA